MMIALKNILVPTDLNPTSEAALRYGRLLAETFGADLHLLHVMDTSLFQARFADPAAIEAAAREQLNDRLAAIGPCSFATHIAIDKVDSPTEAILRYARSASIDLIVMGTHGHKGAAHLLMGSVAEQVVRTAPCPVLVVRHGTREVVADTDLTASMSA